MKISASEEAAGLSFAGPTGTRDTCVVLEAKGTASSLKLRNETGENRFSGRSHRRRWLSRMSPQDTVSRLEDSMTKPQLQELARFGAEARLKALQEEQAALLLGGHSKPAINRHLKTGN